MRRYYSLASGHVKEITGCLFAYYGRISYSFPMDRIDIFRIYAVVILVLLFCTSQGLAVTLYRYTDKNGTVHFTDSPTDSRYQLVGKQQPRKFVISKQALQKLIRTHSRWYSLDEALVKAVIRVESNFDYRAVSRKGATGLMQLLPETAREMKVYNLFDPDDNVRGGSAYLRYLLNRYNGNLNLTLAAYNAGPGAVTRHGGIPPFEETVNYIRQVKKYIKFYRRHKDVLL